MLYGLNPIDYYLNTKCLNNKMIPIPIKNRPLTILYPILNRVEYYSVYEHFPIPGDTGLGTLKVSTDNQILTDLALFKSNELIMLPWVTLSEDIFGKILYDSLKLMGVNLSFIEINNYRNTTFFYKILEERNRQIITFSFGGIHEAIPRISISDIHLDYIYLNDPYILKGYNELLTLIGNSEEGIIPIMRNSENNTTDIFTILEQENVKASSAVIINQMRQADYFINSNGSWMLKKTDSLTGILSWALVSERKSE